MTLKPRARLLAVLSGAGLLLTVIVPFLFYAVTDPSTRGSTFTFSAWFSATQVVLLFSSLLYAAVKDGRPGSVVPLNSAIVVVTFYYNLVAVGTVILFTEVLLPRGSTPRTYYAVCLAELGVAIAITVLLQIVAISHQVGHGAAIASRERVDELLARCDSISANATSKGWNLEILRLSERIRFSEGLHRNSSLAAEVALRLSELESLTNSNAQPASRGEAQRLIAEIESLAFRRG